MDRTPPPPPPPKTDREREKEVRAATERGLAQQRAEAIEAERNRREAAHRAAARVEFESRLRYEMRRSDPGGLSRMRAALAVALLAGADVPRSVIDLIQEPEIAEDAVHGWTAVAAAREARA